MFFFFLFLFYFKMSFPLNGKIAIFLLNWGKKSFIFQKCQKQFWVGGKKWVGRGTTNICFYGWPYHFINIKSILTAYESSFICSY